MDRELFEIINRIANEHSGSKKTFGYLTEEDLHGEIWTICLEIVKNFDQDRGKLEHFLRVSVKNRLINKYKDIIKIVKPPCPRCPFYLKGQEPDCGKFGDEKELCRKWKKYMLSKESRNNLLNATEHTIERLFKDNTNNAAEAKEIVEIIRNNIRPVYNKDFTSLLNGYKISKNRLEKLKKEINRVLQSADQKKFVPLTIGGNHATTDSQEK